MSPPSSPYRTPEPGPLPVVVTTGPDVPGRVVVEILGVVRGVALRRVPSVPETALEQAIAVRRAAELRLIEEAEQLRAHAVIGMRYDSNDGEIVAYGTAVRLQEA
jgi:uncharacterized protein YbjQ (UPF0145 family)